MQLPIEIVTFLYEILILLECSIYSPHLWTVWWSSENFIGLILLAFKLLAWAQYKKPSTFFRSIKLIAHLKKKKKLYKIESSFLSSIFLSRLRRLGRKIYLIKFIAFRWDVWQCNKFIAS